MFKKLFSPINFVILHFRGQLLKQEIQNITRIERLSLRKKLYGICELVIGIRQKHTPSQRFLIMTN